MLIKHPLLLEGLKNHFINMKFYDEWDKIVSGFAFDIYSLEELEDLNDIQFMLFSNVEDIFIDLKKLKKERFFVDREIQAMWIVLTDKILYLNEYGRAYKIDLMSIVLDIFDELLVLCEKFSEYECAGNLLKFRDKWLFELQIKIKKSNVEK